MASSCWVTKKIIWSGEKEKNILLSKPQQFVFSDPKHWQCLVKRKGNGSQQRKTPKLNSTAWYKALKLHDRNWENLSNSYMMQSQQQWKEKYLMINSVLCDKKYKNTDENKKQKVKINPNNYKSCQNASVYKQS